MTTTRISDEELDFRINTEKSVLITDLKILSILTELRESRQKLSRAEQLVSALEEIGKTSIAAFIGCNGEHRLYSCMHPNADTICKKCGESNDGPGGSIRQDLLSADAKRARLALEKWRGEK